jgi:hypothetical protein
MSKVAILTNFMEFQPGYSLTGICKDQIRMLTERGHEVHLFVNDKYHGEAFDPRVVMHKTIPFAHLHDFMSIKELADPGKSEFEKVIEDTAQVYRNELVDFDIAFTHDFVFTGWFLPYGQACKRATKDLPKLKWLHWIHSVPTGYRDYWDIKSYGPAHMLIFPNKSDRLRVAEQFRGTIANVRVIPHIKDLRTWMDFDDESCEFIKDYPALMSADIVQVYPASVDRLEAKRVRETILIFAKLKKMGFSVCLVIADQWATARQRKQDVERYMKIGWRNGLRENEELIFSSLWKLNEDKTKGKYEVGLPKRILRDVMMCTNLFMFPTREESFGLVLPEISLSSGCLCILNNSLDSQREISDGNAIFFDFGSFTRQHSVENEDKYFTDIAQIIVGRMRDNESLMLRTHVRQKFNWDYLYSHYYLPIMAESELWI